MKHDQTKTKTKRNNKKQTPNKGMPKTKNILASKTNHRNKLQWAQNQKNKQKKFNRQEFLSFLACNTETFLKETLILQTIALTLYSLIHYIDKLPVRHKPFLYCHALIFQCWSNPTWRPGVALIKEWIGHMWLKWRLFMIIGDNSNLIVLCAYPWHTLEAIENQEKSFYRLKASRSGSLE
jgi:hypothetical protein